MFHKDKLSLMVMVVFTLLIFVQPATASANSAEPPALVILVNNPPDDLEIAMESGDKLSQARFRRTAWEGYYVFYPRDMLSNDYYTIKVTTSRESYEITLSGYLEQYHNVVTLDLSNRTLTPGKYPFRQALLVAIRLLLTLLIEGLVFWRFGYREKRSWLVFLAINLFTQGTLNIWLSGGGSVLPNYLMLGLFFGEIFVFVFEMIAFPILIKEKEKGDAVGYAFMANFISLFAGGFMISLLPV